MQYVDIKKDIRRDLNRPDGMCPFVEEPEKECYCFKLDSNIKIRASIHYCQSFFQECKIYQRRISDGNNIEE